MYHFVRFVSLPSLSMEFSWTQITRQTSFGAALLIISGLWIFICLIPLGVLLGFSFAWSLWVFSLDFLL